MATLSSNGRIFAGSASRAIGRGCVGLTNREPSDSFQLRRCLRLTSLTFPSMVFNGGKGAHVSGNDLGLIVSGGLLGNRVRDVKGLMMTRNKHLKRRVRARAAKTGESYTAALRHLREPARDPAIRSLRMAVAQTSLFNDPREISALRASGAEMRGLMEDAWKAGARLIHFPEGTTCWPGKRIMSIGGPAEIGPSDWTRCAWHILREELEDIQALAGRLKLWTVFGSAHPLTPPNRPHNSIYVVSDRGEIATRYDERLLSRTKLSFMYTPGKSPVTFEVDNIRFGCALGMETHYPEIFVAYEKLDVDCVLFSTSGESPAAAPAFAAEALGHAASNTYWVSYAAHAPQSAAVPSGIAGPDGQWKAQCPMNGLPALAVTDITIGPENRARPWRRQVRTDLYAAHQVSGDPRSDGKNLF
ncbi:putative amidohydrolase [Hyphomicrobiales bacterium]|nr:putative amidohydrolase [Hyphomicrobiales bacterium]CAH1695964.1 putative amidohydrolase [Hyphomicrobiales bacterium]